MAINANINGSITRRYSPVIYSAAAAYMASRYNSDYDCLANQGYATGDSVFGANLYSDRARVYGGVAITSSPGTSTNGWTTADSAALDITGNIDIIVRLSLVDWTPSASIDVLNKWAPSNQSYLFRINTTGTIAFYHSTTGANNAFSTSSVAHSFTDGQTGWIRVTRDSMSGDVKFYTATDAGTNTLPTWTQLGTTVAGTAGSIYSGTASLRLGMPNTVGGGTEVTNGVIYYSEIRNAIDGSAVSIFDPSAVPNYSYGWRSSTGEDWLTNVSTAYNTPDFYKVAPAQLGSAGFYTNVRLWGGCSFHPGTASNYWTTPHTASWVNSTDEHIAYIIPADWTAAAYNIIAAKRASVTACEGQFFINNGSLGTLGYYYDVGGSSRAYFSTVATGFQDGTGAWVRVTRTQNGGNQDVRFYTSREHPSTNPDLVNWTQLGSTVTLASANPSANTASTYIGFDNSSNVFSGQICRYIHKSTIGGTTVIDFNPELAADLSTSFTGSDGRVYTVTKTTGADTNDPTRLVYAGEKYTYITGVAGNYISTPDSATISVTSDVEFRSRVRLIDYTSGFQTVGSKFSASGNQRSLMFDVLSSAGMRIVQSTTGADETRQFTSSTTLPAVDNSIMWLRWTLDVDNGASGSTATFYYAADNGSNTPPTVWTQLGTPVVVATAANTFDSTAPLTISGVSLSASQNITGSVYYADLVSGINGTIVAKYDASLAGQTGYTDTLNNTVWTHNRSATGKKLTFVTETTLLLADDDYCEIANHPLINFGATQSFTLFTTNRCWDVTGATTQFLLRKSAGAARYSMAYDSGGGASQTINDGTNATNQITADTTSLQGNRILALMSRDMVADTSYIQANAISASGGENSVNPISNASVLRMGSETTSVAANLTAEVFGFGVIRKSLTAAERARLATEA